ncbi:MAG: bifunctional phosphoribosylaminoimidazolecarboxamide formyltransferase/IMP cyclohydrolase, partial [Bacteroidetes bacterium]|nr:bifunctional phosphoribosylaminoimidazolecarboxamide formyltransferase/IMP cyclohydrolase [Bacteroidota bacterium]
NLESDLREMEQHKLPYLDLVVVDLYPFEETLAKTDDASAIIEKIDIGGISLIRAAAKNHRHTAILASKEDIPGFVTHYLEHGGTTESYRRELAGKAFGISSGYDALIGAWMQGTSAKTPLRYGENPHQPAWFEGDLSALFDKIQGKELSYNNLLDIDAAVQLLRDFETENGVSFAILKHNNACGMSTRDTAAEAYKAALQADPVSAFGGILICNAPIDPEAAKAMNDLFFEVLIAPDFAPEALELLSGKKNRIILRQKNSALPKRMVRSVLNGILVQERDECAEVRSGFNLVTALKPAEEQYTDLEFAIRLVKHTKSNAIVLVKNRQLLASGTGQTSRVDALEQAISKAHKFGFDLKGAVMASDAFFPFPDCVEISAAAGITAIAQPGGSIKDADSIAAANQAGIAMVMTGVRHFKH